jgi:bifunctional DNA-binding transcriptional regulator/antitoxin component of YhaV-PrlF toxin-antitoxin module
MRENKVRYMFSAILTSKGRVTIPKEIRKRLRFRTGQCLELRISSTSHSGCQRTERNRALASPEAGFP